MTAAATWRTTLDGAALQRLRELDANGQSQLIDRVFSAFEASMARMLPELARAGAALDLPSVRHVSHTLKSSAAVVGALRMARQCADIEAMVREQRSDGLAERIDELLAEAVGVRAALQAVPERNP